MENLGVTEVMVLVLGIMGLTLGAFGFKAFVDVRELKKEWQQLKADLEQTEPVGNQVKAAEADEEDE